MAVTLHVTPADRHVLIVGGSGPISADELRQVKRALAADSFLPRGAYRVERAKRRKIKRKANPAVPRRLQAELSRRLAEVDRLKLKPAERRKRRAAIVHEMKGPGRDSRKLLAERVEKMSPAAHRQRKRAGERSAEKREQVIGEAESFVPDRDLAAFRWWANRKPGGAAIPTTKDGRAPAQKLAELYVENSENIRASYGAHVERELRKADGRAAAPF